MKTTRASSNSKSDHNSIDKISIVQFWNMSAKSRGKCSPGILRKSRNQTHTGGNTAQLR